MAKTKIRRPLDKWKKRAERLGLGDLPLYQRLMITALSRMEGKSGNCIDIAKTLCSNKRGEILIGEDELQLVADKIYQTMGEISEEWVVSSGSGRVVLIKSFAR